MRNVIRWAVQNSPAMNTLMVATLVFGMVGMLMMRREVFPEFELEIVLITVPYPGASPEEVEEGVCQKLEEACRSIAGIKRQTSIAREGSGFSILELEASVKDVQKIVNEVRSEVDQIPSFPELTEDPEIRQLTIREAVIRVGVLGPESNAPNANLVLREKAERVRDDILQLPTVSQANLVGAKDYQIDIEIPEETLRKHGLTLKNVAQLIRRENIELPGGTIRTTAQEILLRGKNKRLTGEEIAKIPLVTQENGVVLTIGDLGVVRDEFTDGTSINEVNGRPAAIISVERTSSEDLLVMVAEVLEYVSASNKNGDLDDGYELVHWADRSVDVRDRMNMLAENGFLGLAFVFLVLAIFLELRLAFWVALGIPIAVLGAGGGLFLGDQTLNMLSMFAFLMALGIVVDDAIVIGENIYSHRQHSRNSEDAAVNGAFEVLPSVIASVSTTIIAFLPLMFVAGIMGKFIGVLPRVVIAMLAISLIESVFILPCHLAHRDNLLFKILGIVLYPFRPIAELFRWLNGKTQILLNATINNFYLPTLKWSLHNPAIVIASVLAISIATVGLVRSGITPLLIFPKLDSNWILAKVTFPDGTPASVTDDATHRIVDALEAVNRKLSVDGYDEVVQVRYRYAGQITADGPTGPDSLSSGSHVGGVDVELLNTTDRSSLDKLMGEKGERHSENILKLWRDFALDDKENNPLRGADTLTFGTPQFGPGGTPVEFKLLAPKRHMDELEDAVEKIKTYLAERWGERIYNLSDDSRPGKWEYQFAVKEKAKAMGITAADLAETVRGSYYGEEVMRLQRGRHEVKLMVRYPRSERRSLANLEEIRVRSDDGAERPLTELAHKVVTRGYSEINRVDQLRSITIKADVDETKIGGNDVVADLKATFFPKLFDDHKNIRVRWEGQQEQNDESLGSLFFGFLMAILGMFALLTLEFRSYLQPLMIIFTIPFGFVGAVWGHAFLSLPLTMFTMFGLVALTGVIVNDSIVLIDFINKRIHEGVPLTDALLDAGRRRFRPVLLTSVTTVAGLLPLLLETSFQAQILIPMAVSMAFGLILATPLILILVPVYYSLYGRLMGHRLIADNVDKSPPVDVSHRHDTTVLDDPQEVVGG